MAVVSEVCSEVVHISPATALFRQEMYHSVSFTIVLVSENLFTSTVKGLDVVFGS